MVQRLSRRWGQACTFGLLPFDLAQDLWTFEELPIVNRERMSREYRGQRREARNGLLYQYLGSNRGALWRSAKSDKTEPVERLLETVFVLISGTVIDA